MTEMSRTQTSLTLRFSDIFPCAVAVTLPRQSNLASNQRCWSSNRLRESHCTDSWRLYTSESRD